MKKKIVTILLITLMVLTSVNFYRCTHRNTKNIVDKMKTEKSAANKGDMMQGRYLLYMKNNGIKTFPFIFGERMYIYDVLSGHKYLADYVLLPMGDINDEGMLWGDYVFTDETDISVGDTGDFKQINLKNNKKINFTDYGAPEQFSAYKGGLYYTDVFNGIDKKTTVYVSPIETNNKSKILFKDYMNYFNLVGKYMIYVNPKAHIIVDRNLDTEKENKYTYNYSEDFIYASRGSDGNVIAIDERGMVYKSMGQSEMKACFKLKGDAFDYSKFSTKGNSVYYYNGNGSIKCIDLSRQKSEVLFDLSKHLNNEIKITKTTTYVNFSQNYISVELRYGNKQILYILNYNGTILRKLNL